LGGGKTLNIEIDAPPLHVTKEGVVRVGNTRVPLETVIWTYQEGASPEEIVMHYDVLELADVHAVIAYYLKHREDVDAYIEGVLAESEQVRQENEARFDMRAFRERLLARKAAQQKG
jgi:uncharacterized protein (DUF433 family)